MKRKLSDVLPPDAFKGQKVVPFTKEKIERPAEDVRPRQLFRFRLRNGLVAQVTIPDAEGERLFRRVQFPSDFHYVDVFDSFKHRIAINLRHVVATQFDYMPSEAGLPEGLWIDDHDIVQVFFADSPQPTRLDIESDEMTIAEFDEGNEKDDDACQLDSMFFYFGMAYDDTDDVVHLRDADGASIWLRISEIALVTVPLELLRERPKKSRRKATKKK